MAVENQPFHLPIYSYSYYLFTIILTDYSNIFDGKDTFGSFWWLKTYLIYFDGEDRIR